jgi:NAD(P)-dependent dehydrogenase (short-subunit alcohol dehydrogenase family)
MNVVNKKIVFITGASSGIGRACTLRLVQAGWLVFAGIRKLEDGENLQAEVGTALVPVMMDVKDYPSIIEAAKQVTTHLNGSGLDGLVNVAGKGVTRPVEYIMPDDLQEMFDVNVFGQIAVSQAFLPLLRKARGRIVNITSVGAHVAIPFGGLLNASKSAFGLFSDALRLELHPFGVRVCVIEPGAIKTPAVDKMLGDVEAVIADLPLEGAKQYGEMLREFNRRAYAQSINGSPPDVVARAVQHALTARHPRIRYQVGKGAKLLVTLPRILPDRLLDAIRLRIFGLPSKFGAIASSKDN